MRYENTQTSLVVVGQLNPAILSHDFLDRNAILPSGLVEGQPSPTITPLLSLLEYQDRLKIIVEMGRFIAQSNLAGAAKLLPDLVAKYFETLPHTPLQSVGINFHGELHPGTADEIARLAAKVKPEEGLAGLPAGIDNPEWRLGVRFPHEDFKLTVSLDWIAPVRSMVKVSANYHRDLKDAPGGTLKGLQATLSKSTALREHFEALVMKWLG